MSVWPKVIEKEITMRLSSVTAFAVLIFSMCVMNVAQAQEEPPFISGDYWEVTGIKTADGAGLKYARWLAGEWRKNSEFAKSQGWIKDFMVISNVHARSDEPAARNIWIGRRKAWIRWPRKAATVPSIGQS
jgi:hypothetical protein